MTSCMILLSSGLSSWRSEVPECSHQRSTGGCGGLFGDIVRGQLPVHHPRQEGDADAQGHGTGQENPRGRYRMVSCVEIVQNIAIL